MDECEFLALRWRVYTQICLKIHQNPEIHSKIVIYEDLCSNPEDHIPLLMRTCGLNYSTDIQNFIKQSTY